MKEATTGGALRYFKALSDETRLRLLNILCFQEFNVQELMGILDMGQSRISRHLRVLQDAGLIESRRDGVWAFYRASDRNPGRRFSESIRYLFDGQNIYQEDLQAAGALIRTGKQQSRRFFDSVAPDWEIMKRSVIGDLDLVGTIIGLMPPARSAADLGCGSGALLERLADTVETAIGVDSSREMLAEAARRLKGRAQPADLRIGELEHLPLRDGETEVAIINLVLHHLRNPREGLQEARRVLSEGGTLIVADFCRHDQEMMRSRYGDRWLGFDDSEMERWLEQAGIRVDEHRRFPVRRGLEVFLYSGGKREPSEPALESARSG